MLHNNRRVLFSVFSILTLSIASFSAKTAVVASIKPLAFIAAAIAEGVTPVNVLLPDGMSEHGYVLRPSDIQKIRQTDLLIWVGPDMESFLSKPAAELSDKKNLILTKLPAINSLLTKENDLHLLTENSEVEEHHHHHGEYNLHIWLSPEMARQIAQAVHDKLLALMPKDKVKLDENLQHFNAELTLADQRISAQLSTVKGKGYFVFHDAYYYFERHYGLSSLGYFTINPEIQPGAQRLSNIRSMLMEHKAVCIFAEPQFRPAVIHAVAQGTGVRQGTLDPLGTAISISADSYVQFLIQLADQYQHCLKGT